MINLTILTSGFVGLLQSKKAVMSLLILIIASVLCFTGHVDSLGFSAVVGVIQAIYCYTQHRVDLQSLSMQQDKQ